MPFFLLFFCAPLDAGRVGLWITGVSERVEVQPIVFGVSFLQSRISIDNLVL